MKSISTGFGLAILGGCIFGAAVVASPRLGRDAFAQGTGGERRIVNAGIYAVPAAASSQYEVISAVYSYRIWSDNSIDLRCLGRGSLNYYNGISSDFSSPWSGGFTDWRTVDNGTSGFRPLTDVDMSGEVDGGDISQVLLDMNTRSDDLPPPPIDCTINAPR